jgi:H+/Cl- antiporter ClcA
VFLADKVKHSVDAWAACVVIGVLTGAVDGLISKILHALFAIKDDLITWTSQNLSVFVTGLTMFAFCVPLTLAAMAMVIFVAPMATGSGLAEIKALLNGSPVPGTLSV